MIPQDTTTTGKKGWLLVVHKNAGHARPIETLLEDAGFEVVSASDAEEVTMLIRSGQPDLVIVAADDHSILNKTLGTGHTPIVVVTSDETVETGQEGPRLHWPLNRLIHRISQTFPHLAV